MCQSRESGAAAKEDYGSQNSRITRKQLLKCSLQLKAVYLIPTNMQHGTCTCTAQGGFDYNCIHATRKDMDDFTLWYMQIYGEPE